MAQMLRSSSLSQLMYSNSHLNTSEKERILISYDNKVSSNRGLRRTNNVVRNVTLNGCNKVPVANGSGNDSCDNTAGIVNHVDIAATHTRTQKYLKLDELHKICMLENTSNDDKSITVENNRSSKDDLDQQHDATMSRLEKDPVRLVLKLVNDKSSNLKMQHVIDAIRHIIQIEEEDSVHPAAIAAFLTTLRLTSLDRDADLISEIVEELRATAGDMSFLDKNSDFADICGTGGDGLSTFNVSTTATVICAAAGLKMVKLGNKSSTSLAGSADLLEAAGCRNDFVTRNNLLEVSSRSDLVFLLAPVYFPWFSKIRSVRKNLGLPSLFNIIGPLLNPTQSKYRLFGTFSEEIANLYAEVLARRKGQRSLVVCGHCNMDEVSITGPTQMWLVDNGSISKSTVMPEDFGFKRQPISAVQTKSAQQNCEIFHRMLNNELPDDDPIQAFTLMNAAALLKISGLAESWKDGVDLALRTIRSGRAKRVFENYRDLTQELARKNGHEL